ncbi:MULTISPECIES: hypothetical protein [unclassified Actinomyces]|uniref:hypothetical protein n=1 Tax=unclassified Actinomyces TaxID=2609248 RepID=UPI000D59F746|nr:MULTISPECIES: hypothetical protein [unclassified Actinomyces]RAX19092.1 hypothetical protein DRB07_14885 [Actinomyces sp. Z3]RAX24423.1 hypothetical protein DRB06_01030 [Actinomyces sp. Z5]
MFILVPTTPLDANTIRSIAEATNAMLEEQENKRAARDARTGGSRRHSPVGTRPVALPAV